MNSRFDVKKDLPKSPKSLYVTIPAFKEPDIITTLKSILNADRTGLDIQVKVLINSSDTEIPEVVEINRRGEKEVKAFIHSQKCETWMHVDHVTLPSKYAGVGLARKTLMDAAARYFQDKDVNGLILALDADCEIHRNYFQVISKHFKTTSDQAASIFFEHPLQGTEVDTAIMEYEWHLRYFINLQKWAKFPFAIHTVGSSMCCYSEAYLLRGGMNKRKAGEDFYFLHKFIKDEICGEINGTTVFPSGRISDRVPFGTGRAVGKYEDETYVATTYNSTMFKILKLWNSQVELYYRGSKPHEVHPALDLYLESIDFDIKIQKLLKHVKSLKAFKKRFYQLFDAFQLMKCLHHMRSDFPDVPILKSAQFYFDQIEKGESTENLSLRRALLKIRQLDRQRNDLS